jgi:hypothetical protein
MSLACRRGIALAPSEVMRHAILALFAMIVFVGCKDSASCDGACKTTDAKYGITGRTVHAVDQEQFSAFDGKTYTLVRVEYGDTEECDAFDEACSYSVYCGFIVDGEEYPVYGDFVTDEDVLFDEDEGLTGYDLPIFDDEAFDEWLWETDSEDDILIECFDDY